MGQPIYGVDVNGKSIITGYDGDGKPASGNGRIDALEEHRNKSLERLDSLRNFYERPEAAQLLQMLQSRSTGDGGPFTPDVVNAQLGDNADAGAGAVRNESEITRRAFANSGMGGSGLEASALVSSRRRAEAMSRAGRRSITSRAALENYQAKERAQQQLQGYLQEKQRAEAQAGMAEVDFRSQIREVTDTPNGGSYQAPQTQQPAAPQQPQWAPEQWVGTSLGKVKIGGAGWTPGESGGGGSQMTPMPTTSTDAIATPKLPLGGLFGFGGATSVGQWTGYTRKSGPA